MDGPGPAADSRETRREPTAHLIYRAVLTSAVILSTILAEIAETDQTMVRSAAILVGAFGAIYLASLLVPWRSLPRGAVVPLGFVDLALIAAVNHVTPATDLDPLMFFPVIWLAWSFGRTVGAAGVVVATALVVWPHIDGDHETSTTGSIVLPIVLAGAAIGIHRIHERARRQDAELRTALQRARLEERMTMATLDAVTVFVLTLDTDGRLVSANRQTRTRMADYDLSNVALLADLQVYRDDRRTPMPHAERPYARTLAGEEVDDVLIWLGDPGEPRMALRVSGRRITEPGLPTRILLVARDVTDKLNAIQARDDLVASVSHELRTPITSVLGYVELAREDPELPPSVGTMLDVAVRNIDRMLEMVDDFIGAHREDDERFTLVHAQWDLAQLVTDSVEAFSPAALDQAITVTSSVQGPLMIEADGFRLRHAVDNLLSNAIKYNVLGGRVDVTMSQGITTDGRPAAVVEVSDTGRGMTPEEQRGLFRRFYRAESVRGTSIHGSGLGLHIARMVVQAHDGTIDVSSVASEGTIVTIVLPLQRRTERVLRIS